MLLTKSFQALQPKSLLDACNRESGRIYTQTMVTHWRIYRKKRHWLSQYSAMRLNDFLTGPTTLHAHSRDSAQEGFYKACKTTRTLRTQGETTARYPWKRKRFRTTVWKATGIRCQDGVVLLARARGTAPLRVVLPAYLLHTAILEVRLVYNPKAKHYEWHMVIDDGTPLPPSPGDKTVAVDLGEVHPAAACDEQEAVVVAARALRAQVQGRNKALAELSTLQSRCTRGSRRFKRLQQAKHRLKHQSKRQSRDILHKVSRAVVDFAVERQAGTLVIGDVRDIANGVNKGKVANQKLSQWTHGQLRQYLTYKAQRAGIRVVLQNEAYTSQICPAPGCGHRYKPRGRLYRCPACGWTGHRDGQVGAANLLSAALYGELGRVHISSVKYRHPFLTGKRSRLDTAHVAGVKPEAAGL